MIRFRDFWNYFAAGAGVGALAEAETAAKGILDGRLLLDNSDHVPPLLKQAAKALRTAVTDVHSAFTTRHAELLKDLEAGTQRVVPLADLARELARAAKSHHHG